MATPPEVDQDQNMYVNFDMSDELKGAYLSIPHFYSGRSVFITGGTGFMGKVRSFIIYEHFPKINSSWNSFRCWLKNCCDHVQI